MAVDRLRDYPVIILDSNALFMPFQFKLNLDSELTRLLGEYQVIIPSCVISEIRRLESKEKFGSSALKLALSKPQPNWYQEFEAKLSEEPNTIRTPSGFSQTDREIIKIAKAISGIVVTSDRSLLEQLHANGITTISLRARKYLRLNSI